jgi:hypothetical protein
MRQADRRPDENGRKFLAISVASLPFLALSGCGPTPAPTPYYAARPPVVVVTPQQQPTTQYVYGTVNSTNTTHITSESTVHIITNHPMGNVPPPVVQPQEDNQAAAEPAPPEEQEPREEPSAEPPAEPAAEPAAEAPPEEQQPPPEPQSDSGSSGSDDSDK